MIFVVGLRRWMKVEQKLIEDTLTVTFTNGLNDESGICISRVNNGTTHVLKMELGEQADILYRLLTEQATKTEFCISREEVIKLLEKEDWADTVEGVLALPPVQPRRKSGHWKWELASNGWANHICSECGFKENTDIHVRLNWKFCPKCGAEMEVNNG